MPPLPLTRVTSSLSRDLAFLALPQITALDRARLVTEKYAARARPLLGRPPRTSLPFARREFHLATSTDAAVLQAAITTTHEYLETFGLLGARGVTCIDVGAHNGESALALWLLLDEPIIHSVEALPESFAVAERNVGMFTAGLHNIGLSDTGGEAAFDVSGGAGGDASFSIRPDGDHRMIPVTRGDDLFASVQPDVVKIDVEGYERHVIDGLATTLSRTRFLALEMSLNRSKDHQYAEIARRLADLEFDLVRVSRPHGVPGAPQSAVDMFFARELPR